MKVTLRQKPISGNRFSLYLDYYPAVIDPVSGKTTRREFLDLYIYADTLYEQVKYTNDQGKQMLRYDQVMGENRKPKTVRLNPMQRNHNAATMQLADNIRAKRQLELQEGNYGFMAAKTQRIDFLQFFKDMATKRAAKAKEDQTKSGGNWTSGYKTFSLYVNGSCPMSRVTEKFCADYKEHLLNKKGIINVGKLSAFTAGSYFTIFNQVINEAVRAGLLKSNPCNHVKKIKLPETQREFLTLDEVKKLAAAECEIEELKRAGMFSIYTGLRWSDVTKLTWGEVYRDGDEQYIRITTKKGKAPMTLPISAEAVEYLGEREEPGKTVFPRLKYSDWLNSKLKDWVRRAGITKHITFHCFRHTHATLLLTLGTDLYTVSKMLGHRDIKTTAIYAKIVDKKKQEAANKIRLK